MASSFSARLRLDLPANSDTGWAAILRTDIGTLLEEAIAGYTSIALSDANYTLSTANGATDEARQMMLRFTGSLTANRNIVVPTSSKLYFISNATTGGFSLVVKTTAGSGITVPAGMKAVLYCDGTNVVDAVSWLSSLTLTGALSVGGAATVTGTLSPLGLIDASGASAGQIKFPATQNASSDVNTLDDYEEGTFTPSLLFGGANTGMTTSSANGTYIKIGALVYIRLNITLTAKGSSTGAATVSGLPFSSAASGAVTVGQCALFTGLTGALQAFVSGSSITFRQENSAGNVGITDTVFTASTVFQLTATYT